MHLQESGEMYLETILILSKKSQFVRSIDVSEYMNFSKPSVSRAIGLLKSGGYINVDASGYITLTDSGNEIACKIYERHNVLSEFLKNIGVEAETAAADACKIEHNISDETFEALKKHIKLFEK
ncbi:MAG: metal-dependent transcriptional regulator [Acutalibacteraceae bacterium]|nr:metal-dependent transcriptional regulator [Clostridia bacterium]MEE1329945.1 metal-dependent transcriptional regulator [Acutalibacteraceae bacterium]